MKTTTLLQAAAAMTAALVSTLHAQTPESAAAASPAATTPAPDQTIYSPRLPSAAELTNAAAAQNQKIEKIDQTNSAVTVVYRTAGGQTQTVSYLLLPAADTGGLSVATPSTPAPAVSSGSTTVIYAPPPPVYYYPAYYPWGWYGPRSVHIGLGFGFYGHGYRGGFHHGWRH
jgi:hypothetical protein